MNTGPIELEQWQCQPEDIVCKFNLIYTHEQELRIVRRKYGKGFNYFIDNNRVTDISILERIKKLVIPPMWVSVKISHLENSHLQAVGRDSKNRKQYLYHTQWNTIRNATKFYKMYAFGKVLPSIRKQVEQDLNKKIGVKEKVIALVIRLMEETHIRIGNAYYEKENKTYGLTTLRKRHIHKINNIVKIQFIGKKGKEHIVTVRNKKLIKLIKQCEELPGWELFKYIGDDGERRIIKSNDVNEYLYSISGQKFTAKDFRTWSASMTFFNTLCQFDRASSEEEIKKNILKGYEEAALALGNTKNVCKKYYVHPIIVDSYEKGKLNKIFNRIKRNTINTPYFSFSEKEILKLFKNYYPDFDE